MPYDRTIEIALASSVKIQFNQAGRPTERYSVLLMILVDGAWQAVRVYDNHRGMDHVHRYTRSGGKQDQAPFHPGPTNEAIPAAIGHLKDHWQAIIESWDT